MAKKWRPAEIRKSNVKIQCPNCKRIQNMESGFAISENGKETVFFDRCSVCGKVNEVSFYKALKKKPEINEIDELDYLDDLFKTDE